MISGIHSHPMTRGTPGRRFRFSLRVLLLCIIPYLAVVTFLLTVSSGAPEPPRNFLYFYPLLAWEIGEAIFRSMMIFMAVIFTVAWFFAWFGAAPTWRLLKRAAVRLRACSARR